MASNTIIQCNPSSSHPIRTYDVFMSFRGETRNNFTGFLFDAMARKGIEAFKDDKDIRKGKSIAPELLQAIAGSHVFVVVFSKDYASSTWCLRELAHICKCIQTSPRLVLPIFYDVDPSEVRKQIGYYGKAFAKHQERFREEEVKIWREVVTRVANLSGWDIREKQQHVEIENIVQVITNILGPKFSTLPKDNLVGMESRLDELAKLLCLGSLNDIRVVGISGMGGIGKSTLGRALYESTSHRFHFRCYIDDVSKIYRDSSTLGVQKQLLSQSLNEKNLEICNVSEGTCLAWTRLRHVRALIVLDNVDQVEQLKMFTGSRNTLLRDCLGGGSRIIIISRDQQILKTHGVDDIYLVQPLNCEKAVQLFCRKAFKSNYIMSGFQKLTCDVLSHAEGHPLAIEVLGSSLFERDVSHWRSALVRLKENKSKRIMDVLRISFDELEDTEKEIFLDIACFFTGHDNVEFVIEILNSRGICTEDGLQVLVDKSLITIKDGWVEMHKLLMDLGRCIVREKSPNEPRRWSRLWDYKDFHKVMLDNKAAKNLEAIVVRYIDKLPVLKADAISKMRNLKLLELDAGNFEGSLNYLPNELGYLCWKKYPFECLPQSFEPYKLVKLSLCYGNIKQLWKGRKLLHNLRSLDLSHSENLIELPDFGEAINLETLNLEGCNLLRFIHPSIGLLTKLSYLNLENCKNLESLPKSILGINSLVALNLSGCSKMQFLEEPSDAKHLKKLYICEAPIHSQSMSSYSREQKELVSCLLPSPSIFPHMCVLDLGFCNLVQIPDAIGNLFCLEFLNLSGNNFATLPNLKELSKLFYLYLQHCKRFKYLPELPSGFDCYTLDRCEKNARLLIFNCPELVDREYYTSMGISWMIQSVQKYQALHQFNKCRALCANIQSVTPGSEIPRWFNNQLVSMDNYVSIDASSVMNNNNWIGMVFCAIFVVRNETVSAMGPSKTKTKTKRWYFGLGDLPVDFYGHLDLELVSDESDYMWLLFLNRNEINEYCLQGTDYPGDMTWHFKIKVEPGFHVEVKKYAYRYVYDQDLELSNLTMMQSRNSLPQKRKLLAIEQSEGRNQGKRSKGRISAEDAANSSLENTIKLLQNKFANLGL